ncbi:hypothetical protein VNO77_23926 [Canavalia gladiata]|uniref:Uncharacterized protein n=1 Tax=Canavalia gladiata TaxID=3824 RepID=A0AAN9QC92_CANGL
MPTFSIPVISDTRKRHQTLRVFLSFHINRLRQPAREYSRSAIMFLLHSIDIQSNKPNPNTLPLFTLHSLLSSDSMAFRFNSDR